MALQQSGRLREGFELPCDQSLPHLHSPPCLPARVSACRAPPAHSSPACCPAAPQRLRALPVVHPHVPTLCLVGAPNVGKSSLVQAISSGKPEVSGVSQCLRCTACALLLGHLMRQTRGKRCASVPEMHCLCPLRWTLRCSCLIRA